MNIMHQFTTDFTTNQWKDMPIYTKIYRVMDYVQIATNQVNMRKSTDLRGFLDYDKSAICLPRHYTTYGLET